MFKTCAYCGKSFETRFGTDYCSAKCKRIAEGITEAEPQHKQRNPHIYIRTCIICGKPFETYSSRKNTCSKECAVLKNRQRVREYYYKKRQLKERQLKEPPPLRPAVCPVCGKIFETSNPRKISCSPHCAMILCYQNRLKKRPKKYKSCVICGKKFHVNHPKKLICSDSCRDIYRYLKRVSHNKFRKEFNHDC